MAALLVLLVLGGIAMGIHGGEAGQGTIDVPVAFVAGTEPDFPALVAEYTGAELVVAEAGADGLRATFRVSASKLDDYALLFDAVPYATVSDPELSRTARALAKELLDEGQASHPPGGALHDSLAVRFRDVRPETLASFDAVFGTSTHTLIAPVAVALVHVPEGSATIYHRLVRLSPIVRSVAFNAEVSLD